MELAMDRNEVRIAIEQAFANVDANGVQTVSELLLADGGPNEAFGKDYRGPWRDVPFEWLAKYESLSTFADVSSLVYYSPAIMRWILIDDQAIGTTAADYFIATLIHRGREYVAKRDIGWSFVNALSHDQKQAIVAFLNYLAWNLPSETTRSHGTAIAVWNSILVAEKE